MRPVNIFQKKLQQHNINIKEAAEEIETLSCFFGNENDKLKLITRSIIFAEKGSNLYGFTTSRRARRKKRLAGEEGSDAGLSMKEEFRRVATEVLDRMHMEMRERFQRLRDHVGRFGFLLEIDSLLSSDAEESEEMLQKHCADFASFYDEINPQLLFHDIIDARVLFVNKEIPKTPEGTGIIKKLAEYGSDVCPHLTTAIRILLTQAVSVASCERSFSKLKMIKNYLRSTMAQDRLCSLALMSVETEI